MTEHAREPIPGWHLGLDPEAGGLAVRSMGRADHPLGEALRLELVIADDDGAPSAIVHVQWYIATRSGPWAMWTVGTPSEVAERESVLCAVTWPLPDAASEPLAEVES